MKFFIENQKIEKEIEWVLNQVRLHMNGATTSQMDDAGIRYRQNYGVGLPHLQQLANRISGTFELAERLWFMEIRETMILATMVVPHHEMTMQRCLEWSAKINNVDIVERSAMFLWGKLDIIDDCIPLWLNEGVTIKRALAYYTMGRKIQNSPSCDRYSVSDVLTNTNVETDDMICLRAASFLLRMLIRNGAGEQSELSNFITKLVQSSDMHKQLLGEELQSEIDYMNDGN